jgi:hypothetical protein
MNATRARVSLGLPIRAGVPVEDRTVAVSTSR